MKIVPFGRPAHYYYWIHLCMPITKGMEKGIARQSAVLESLLWLQESGTAKMRDVTQGNRVDNLQAV